ncbi:MAG TPA: FAD-dependent oxidoreductase, partial [Longimicrobiales bacterium]
MNKTVAIIGGGAAGLSAAQHLRDGGAAVTVFERAQTLGGRARSELLAGCMVDVGAQLFGSAFTSLYAFVQTLGAQELLVRSPGRDAVLRGGTIHPITYGSVSSMITSRALPASLKFRLATRYVPFLLRHASQLDACEPLANGGDALEGESVAEWGARELGADFVELLAYPLLGAYYGSTPEATSVVLYHALAGAGMDVTLRAIRGGTGALFQTAGDALRARGARIELNRVVNQVSLANNSVLVDGVRFDGAVLAVPPRVVQSLFQPDPVTAEWLRGVRYSASAVLALVLRERIRADYFGISIPRGGRGSDLVAICVAHQKAPGLVPEDRTLLVCLGAPAANESLIAHPETAVERMINSVEHVLPGTRSRIEHAKLYRHHDGYPLFYPGYLKHLRDFPVTAQTHNVMLAGDYLVS